MKLRNLLFIGIAAAAMFAGCKEDEVMKPAAVEIQPESLSFTTEAETKEISLLATRNWTATVTGGDGWLTVEPMSGDGSNDAQTVKVSVVKNEEGPKSATVTFSASTLKTELKISQEGAEGGLTTIASFLAASPSDDVWYNLKGEITEIANTTYGNLTIKDETGTVYVYGVTEEKQDGTGNDKSFGNLDLKVGDILTLCGIRSEHNGEAQMGSQERPAYYIDHIDSEDIPVEWPETVTPIADILAMTDNNVQVRTTGTVYGTYKAGVVIKDEDGDYLVVYDNGADAPFAELGDEIDVVGTTYLYNDLMMEINYKDHKVLSQDNPYTENAEPVRITSETIEAFDKTKVSYIQFEGILIQSGNYFNVMIDGVDDVQGSLSYVLDSFNLDESANTKMVFTGYFCGAASEGKYLNMMVMDAEPASDPWLYLPETSLTADSKGGTITFTVSAGANTSWSVSSDDNTFTLDPSNGTGTHDVTVTCPANETEAAKTVTLTITAGENIQTVTINQAAPLAGGDEQVSWGIANQTWSTETHTDYGAGFSATDQKIKVGFYKHESTNTLKTPAETYDAIRVYKNAMLVIEAVDGKKIKSVVMETEDDKRYCSDMPVTGGTTATASLEDYTVTWTGYVDVFEAQASNSQVRIEKLTVIYGD